MRDAPALDAADPVLATYVASAKADAETLGVLLHGSRASGQPREDSDYDLIRIVVDAAYEARRERGQLHERVSLEDGTIADVLYQTPSRIETYVSSPGWYTATYLGARIAFDPSGDIGRMLVRTRSEADRIAHESTATAYDAYLNSFVRSMKSARHGDQLGQRLHAAESALALIRTLFGLESRWPPYHDMLVPALPEIEQAQGWPAEYLSMALTRLVGDADASFQQQLEDRVERLMDSRGVAHEWGDDLKPLKTLRFGTPDSGRYGRAMAGIPLHDIPQKSQAAWVGLRDRLLSMLGDDLVAIWAHGGTTSGSDPAHGGDLDTHVILSSRPAQEAARRIEEVHEATADEHGVEWDTWYIVVEDARRSGQPPHAWREGRRDTSWALHRAHWLAGRYVNLHGPVPDEIVTAPTWDELEGELDRELEHIERHVVEGDTDPYEAAYAILNGSRILRSLETRNVVISKRAAGAWALEHLPARWDAALRAALRSYDGLRTAEDVGLLGAEMAPFVAFVRERLPAPPDRSSDATPRWSGY